VKIYIFGLSSLLISTQAISDWESATYEIFAFCFNFFVLHF